MCCFCSEARPEGTGCRYLFRPRELLGCRRRSDVNPADLAPDGIARAETAAGVERLGGSILFCACSSVTVTGRVAGVHRTELGATLASSRRPEHSPVSTAAMGPSGSVLETVRIAPHMAGCWSWLVLICVVWCDSEGCARQPSFSRVLSNGWPQQHREEHLREISSAEMMLVESIAWRGSVYGFLVLNTM